MKNAGASIAFEGIAFAKFDESVEAGITASPESVGRIARMFHVGVLDEMDQIRYHLLRTQSGQKPHDVSDHMGVGPGLWDRSQHFE